MEKVTLYVPCFNAEKNVGRCLESVLKQSYPVDEILVVDDGSTDRTVEVASKSSVKIIAHSNNEGLGATRNTAIENSRNEFVAALDSDCMASEDWLEKLMENFRDDNIAGVGGIAVESCGGIADRWRNVHMKQGWGEERIINPEFLFGSNTVFRKRVLEDNGYNNGYRTNYEDVELSRRLMKKGFKLVYEPRAVVRHLRKDSINSVMKSSWAWTFHDFGMPDSIASFLKRVKFNGYKMFKYMIEDIRTKNFKLIVMDLIVLPTHTYFDMRYYLKRR